MEYQGFRRLRREQQNGFTIIELLLVIVIIAILAVITIVAYNGITKRAQSTTYAAAADQVEKTILIAMAQGESFELFKDESALLGSSVYSCVGRTSDLPETSEFESGECISGVSAAHGIISVALPNKVVVDDRITNILEASGNLPHSNLPVVRHTGNVKARGIAVSIQWYRTYTNSDGELTYTSDKSVPLKLTVAVSWLSSDMSSCGRGAATNESVIAAQKELYRTTLDDAIAYRDGLMTKAAFLEKYPGTTDAELDNIDSTIALISLYVNPPYDLCQRVIVSHQ